MPPSMMVRIRASMSRFVQGAHLFCCFVIVEDLCPVITVAFQLDNFCANPFHLTLSHSWLTSLVDIRATQQVGRQLQRQTRALESTLDIRPEPSCNRSDRNPVRRRGGSAHREQQAAQLHQRRLSRTFATPTSQRPLRVALEFRQTTAQALHYRLSQHATAFAV